MSKKEMTFELAMKRLEEIVELLEDGDADLDKSLSLFEEGVSLVKYCNGELSNAEQKVKKLTFDFEGNAKEEDLPEMKNDN